MTSENSYYSRAPITEAVIDLRVTLPSGVSLEDLNLVQTEIEALYPNRQDRYVIEGVFSADPELPVASGSRTQLGYAFTSTDGQHVFQARLDGFTFSRLAPYDRWTGFRAEAHRLWELYKNVVKPESVNRIAVRYINRLDLPLPFNDLKEYLRTVPEVSPDLPQGLSGYFMQLQIPQEDIQSTLVLNQALVPSNSLDIVSVLLDIDLFYDRSIPQTDDFIWDFLEQLHERKNQVFEACITDSTRKLLR